MKLLVVAMLNSYSQVNIVDAKESIPVMLLYNHVSIPNLDT